ncbi:MAG TPA: metallophosphoesterase family protein [Smithellaceae bacterium]|nr:metallophosphoesterase family protein [Smithellaceae bacterium]HRS83024.1 metallophosphoesterase family protein [Smithellaceae bacterium]HRV45324.1 metallophosphoesterase family protein [Smithellaceae bacterium]
MKENKVKIGVLSDTHVHGFDPNLKRIIDENFSEVDLIFHAGDLVDVSVLQLFGEKDVKAVYGNMDGPQVREALPEQMILDIGGFRVALIHGWGSPAGMEQKLAQKLGKVDCIVFGHTHYPVNAKIDGVYFFNPGSAMDRRFARNRSVGILEVGSEINGRIINLK